MYGQKYALLATPASGSPSRALSKAAHLASTRLDLDTLCSRARTMRTMIESYTHDLRTAFCPAFSYLTGVSGLPATHPLVEGVRSLKDQLQHNETSPHPLICTLDEIDAALASSPTAMPDTSPPPSPASRYFARTHLDLLATETQSFFASFLWDLYTMSVILTDERSSLSEPVYAAVERSLRHSISLCAQALGRKQAFRPLDIETAVREAASILGLESSMISIQSVHDGANIMGDFYTLTRVFMNLFKNAIEAMHRVSDPRISVTITLMDCKLFVHVQDNGRGIPPEQLTSVLAEAGASSKTEAGIKGMGLNISSEIVQNHEGFMEVTSKIGEGTTFTLAFPIV